jgi:hypothetical protein
VLFRPAESRQLMFSALHQPTIEFKAKRKKDYYQNGLSIMLFSPFVPHISVPDTEP